MNRAHLPSREAFALAEKIVNASPVINVFAACEWDSLSEDGKAWIAAIVEQARKDREVTITLKADTGEMRALLDGLMAEWERSVPDDVRRLVIAARLVAQAAHVATVEIDELDKAAEAFADRVPWDDEP